MNKAHYSHHFQLEPFIAGDVAYHGSRSVAPCRRRRSRLEDVHVREDSTA